MKNQFWMMTLILSTSVFLSGCAKKYIQIFDTQSERITNANDQWIFDNDTITIRYSFWAPGGVMSFAIYNKTNRQLFIDWKNSAFIINDRKMDYWIDQITTSNSKISKSSSVSWISPNVFDWNYILHTNRTSAYLEEGSMVKEERITSLPPHAYVGVNKYRLREDIWKFAGPNSRIVMVSRNDKEGTAKVTEEDFEKSTSPLRFRNFLALSYSDKMDKIFYVDNAFWVSKVREMEYQQYRGKIIGKDNQNNPIYEKRDKKRTGFYWIVRSIYK